MKSKQRTNLPIREAQLHLSFVAQVKLVVGEDGELSIGDVESPTAPTAPPRTKEDIARLSSLFHTKDRNFTRIRANRVGCGGTTWNNCITGSSQESRHHTSPPHHEATAKVRYLMDNYCNAG